MARGNYDRANLRKDGLGMGYACNRYSFPGAPYDIIFLLRKR